MISLAYKNGAKNFREKFAKSIRILKKMVNDPLGKKIRASHCLDIISMLSKGIITILLIDNCKNDVGYGKIKIRKGCSINLLSQSNSVHVN